MKTVTHKELGAHLRRHLKEAKDGVLWLELWRKCRGSKQFCFSRRRRLTKETCEYETRFPVWSMSCFMWARPERPMSPIARMIRYDAEYFSEEDVSYRVMRVERPIEIYLVKRKKP